MHIGHPYFEDNIFDSDNDYEEDFADENTINDEELTNVHDETEGLAEKEEQRLFDLGDAIIFGSMIFGNAYEEGLDRKRQKTLMKRENKKIK